MKGYAAIFFLILFSLPAFAQHDTLVMKNGDELVGEIKKLATGVLILETDYSDEDFKVEWAKVSEIKTKNIYVISLSDGRRVNGSLSSDPTDSSSVMIIQPGGIMSARLVEIVFLKEIESTFLGRLDASLGVGFDLAKANNSVQFTTRSNIGYIGGFWSSNASLDVVRNQQDSIRTNRIEGSLGAKLLMQDNWFLYVSAKFLQSDEQKLDLRSTTNAGAGNFIVNSNKIYISTAGGIAWTNENYMDETPTQNSLELSLGLEVNLFDIEDFSLLTNGYLYPSLTQKGRIRLDFKIDLKYDLPLDFFIKLGYSHNFDNQPAEGASKYDYVLNATFGWEL
jgi:putative salt-induced outer membrane protein YdiY